MRIDADDGAVLVFFQLMPEVPAGASEVDDALSRLNGLERKSMGARIAEFRYIWRIGIRSAVEFPVVEQRQPLQARFHRRERDAPRVFESVYVTDLVAVISGNRQLDDRL